MVAGAQPNLVNSNARIPSIDGRGTAMGGYDVVAYFDYGEPTIGEPDIYADYENTYRFRFASKVTQRKFSGDPERYMPAYGGYCALLIGVDEGEFNGKRPGLYRSDPKVFKIIDDRLYLFSSAEALERWNENETAHKAKSDANWEALMKAREQ